MKLLGLLLFFVVGNFDRHNLSLRLRGREIATVSFLFGSTLLIVSSYALRMQARCMPLGWNCRWKKICLRKSDGFAFSVFVVLRRLHALVNSVSRR